MNENRELLASLFTIIKRFRKNRAFKDTIRVLRSQIRWLTPIEVFFGFSHGEQVLNIGNMEWSKRRWITPKDCWVDNVLDIINHRCDTLYSKRDYFRDSNNQYYLKNKYFMLDNKVYPKDKFTLYNNLAVPNNKIYPLGVFYNNYNGKEMYITARENEEFISVDEFNKLYQDKLIFGLSIERNCTKWFKIIISCLLFKGKYRVTLPEKRGFFGFTKKMLLDCEFSLPNEYKDMEPIYISPYNFSIWAINYLDNRSLVNKMWGELIKYNKNFIGQEGIEKNCKQYLNNLIVFAKKEAEYEK